VGIPSPFSANTTQHCVHLTLNDDECHGTMYSFLNMQVRAETDSHGWLKTHQGQWLFIGIYRGDKAKLVAGTYFAENTFNPATSNWNLLV